MTANRIPPTLSNTPLGIGGSAYSTRVAEEVLALYAGRVNQVTSVTGTNTIAGVCTPALSGGYAHGETFRLTPVANNTGPVTVNLDSKGAADLRSEDNQALANGDVILGVPIEFWYDSTIGDFRLIGRLVSNIAAQLADEIAAAANWVLLGHTLVSAAVSSVVHIFTDDAYSVIKCVGSNISASAGSNTLRVQLRTASTSILNIDMGTSNIPAAGYNGANGEFTIARSGANRRQFAGFDGFTAPASGSVYIAERYHGYSAGGDVALIPNRIQWNFISGNIDSGEFWTFGLLA